MDCRNHVFEDKFRVDVCDGKNRSDYKQYNINSESATIVYKTGWDKTARTDWRRLMFGAYFEEGNAPTGMKVTVDWKDQGWGYRKGRLFICWNGMTHSISTNTAPHERAKYEIVVVDHMLEEWFMSGGGADNLMQFSYVVGGGGGHELILHELLVEFEYGGEGSNYLYGVCGDRMFNSV